MKRWLGKYSDVAYVLLRVVAGLLFAQHGAQKLFGVLGGEAVPPFSIMGLAGIIELAGGLMIALGIFASWVAFIASGEMAVAYFWRHAPSGFWPIQNRGELAALYCFIFLYVATRGSGRWRLTRE
ncbi:MAG TPA: DoxX family protein [Vicinamibacterales bacterium]|nr:DoxX family protein [Vicinamibacterales bacterium]